MLSCLISSYEKVGNLKNILKNKMCNFKNSSHKECNNKNFKKKKTKNLLKIILTTLKSVAKVQTPNLCQILVYL